MRKDLNKVLCEHERHRSWDNFSNYRHKKVYAVGAGEEMENLPGRESMKERFNAGWNNKEFGENLTPLWGFVRKNVGRPWDKVFSELCKTFNMSSVINQHILQHLDGFVEQECFEEDGVVYVRSSRGGHASPLSTNWTTEYFVHPRTGILLKNKHFKSYKQIRTDGHQARATEEAKIHIVIDKDIELCRHDENSTWFVCEQADFPEPKIVETYNADGKLIVTRLPVRPFDAWRRETVSPGWNYPLTRKRGVDGYYAKRYTAKIRTASHKELKKYGLIK